MSKTITRRMTYCIKRRYNPQLGVKFTAMGQLTKKDIKKWEAPLYGRNEIIQFETFAEYEARCNKLGITVK